MKYILTFVLTTIAFVSIFNFNDKSNNNPQIYSNNRVAVIDTGLNIDSNRYKNHLCAYGHKDFTGYGINDEDGHGTKVVDLIIQNAKDSDYCLVIVKWYTSKTKSSSESQFIKALEYIKEEHINLVNLSVSGAGFIKQEDEYFNSNQSAIFITAAGNDGVNLDIHPHYPASYDYKNIIVVGALDAFNNRLEISNYGSKVSFWEKADATSYATAIRTGKFIKENLGTTKSVH